MMLAAYSCQKDIDQPGDEPDTDVLEDLDDAAILKLVKTTTINTAYYKDIFLDGGCELNPGIKENGVVINGKLPYALAKSGITNAEYFLSTVNDVGDGYTMEDYNIQLRLISGTAEDSNGVLLYPDGEPRFRMFYSFGGHSNPHGKTIGIGGRTNINQFYANGGSFAGSCAGAYLAGQYASGGVRYYYNIWKDGNMNGTGVSNSSIDIEIVSPVFASYYGPENLKIVTGTRHNGGGYMDVNCAPAGTEILGRFLNQTGKNSTSAGFYGQPAIWAYKESATSGRLVVTGSHPEDAPSGDILNMTASMFKYAWDGSGIAKVKGVLRNGEMIPMTRTTADNKPEYTAIGDRQCHHFVIYLTKDVKNLNVDVNGEEGYDLELYLKKDDFAFPDNDPDYSAIAGGSNQTITTGKLEKGLWYVTVRCATTVTATEVITDKSKNLGRSFVYSGKTGVLNGVPYNIVASW